MANFGRTSLKSGYRQIGQETVSRYRDEGKGWLQENPIVARTTKDNPRAITKSALLDPHKMRASALSTYLEGTSPDLISDVLNIGVRHESPSGISDVPLETSYRLAIDIPICAILSRGTTFIFILFGSTKVGIGRDGGGSGELLQTALSFGRGLGVVVASTKVHVGRDG